MRALKILGLWFLILAAYFLFVYKLVETFGW